MPGSWLFRWTGIKKFGSHTILKTYPSWTPSFRLLLQKSRHDLSLRSLEKFQNAVYAILFDGSSPFETFLLLFHVFVLLYAASQSPVEERNAVEKLQKRQPHKVPVIFPRRK